MNGEPPTMQGWLIKILAGSTLAAVALAGGTVGASVPAKANPQKVCDAIASSPETPKQELKAIRLAQSGDNPELEAALAKMERAAEKAVKSGKSAPVESDAYNAQLEKVFAFAYEECSDEKVEATLTDAGLGDVPSEVGAGALGVSLDNQTDENVFIGIVKISADNTATAEEIVAALFASEDGNVEGAEFVTGAEAAAGSTGYALGDVEAGRYLLVVGSEDGDASTAKFAELTVS